MREDEGRSGSHQPSCQGGQARVDLCAPRGLGTGEGKPQEGGRDAKREEQGVCFHEEGALRPE